MSTRDFYAKPFDKATIDKLEIFETYTQSWIPTFVMPNYFPEIHLFDFFAGPGYDTQGVAGSPIRIIKKVLDYKEDIIEKSTKVVIHLNDENEDYCRELESAVNRILSKEGKVAKWIKIHIYNKDFFDLFHKLYDKIEQYPSLIILDQFGVKCLSIIQELEQTRITDFLMFVSSSNIWRFGDEEAFRKHLDIDMDIIKEQEYRHIHRTLTEQLNKRISEESGLRLYPFSLKKRNAAHIYGIIFGASDPRAFDKFLKIAWNKHELSGEANYDIHEDVKKRQPVLIGEKHLTKIEAFQKEVEVEVLNGTLKTNADVLKFTYEAGHLPYHARKRLQELKKNGVIDYEHSHSLVSYNSVIDQKKILKYKVLKK